MKKHAKEIAYHRYNLYGPYTVEIYTWEELLSQILIWKGVVGLRHYLFVVDLGWVKEKSPFKEYDDYDPYSIHIVVLSRDRQVVAYWRLTPTTKPYLLRDNASFSGLLTKIEAPSSPTVYEASRFCSYNDCMPNGLASLLLLYASMDYAMNNNIDYFISPSMLSVQELLRRKNYLTQALGDPLFIRKPDGEKSEDEKDGKNFRKAIAIKMPITLEYKDSFQEQADLECKGY